MFGGAFDAARWRPCSECAPLKRSECIAELVASFGSRQRRTDGGVRTELSHWLIVSASTVASAPRPSARGAGRHPCCLLVSVRLAAYGGSWPRGLLGPGLL